MILCSAALRLQAPHSVLRPTRNLKASEFQNRTPVHCDKKCRYSCLPSSLGLHSTACGWYCQCQDDAAETLVAPSAGSSIGPARGVMAQGTLEADISDTHRLLALASSAVVRDRLAGLLDELLQVSKLMTLLLTQAAMPEPEPRK